MSAIITIESNINYLIYNDFFNHYYSALYTLTGDLIKIVVEPDRYATGVYAHMHIRKITSA